MVSQEQARILAEDMGSIVPPPSTFNIPHPTWRPNQYETCQWAGDVPSVGILQAATGSGKSVFPKYLSSEGRSVVLTKTKSLQVAYGDYYDAYLMMGKVNYPCVHPQNEGNSCGECLYAETGMGNCPYSDDCVYLTRKKESLYKRFVCTSFAYYLSSAPFREAGQESLILDECHLGADIALDRAGTVLNDMVRADLLLAKFPRIKTASGTGIGAVLGWINDSLPNLYSQWRNLKKQIDLQAKDGGNQNIDKNLIKRMRSLERMVYKLRATVEALESCPEAWYMRGGPGVGYHRGRPMPGLVVRPLTARYHFPRMFLNGHRTILMSATVGDFDTFRREFGIGACHTRRVPSNFAPERRRVYLLDVPKLNYRSPSSAYEKQADAIAEGIKMCPPEWSGIIHVTRKKEAPLLMGRLARRGLVDRVWVPPQQTRYGKWLGTQDQMALWKERLEGRPNSILVGWQFWEGYDGRDEKINIVAKVPWPFLGDPYEKERKRYSERFYKQRAAWDLQQALGRTRRGREEDYDTEGEMRGFNAIADGSWRYVKGNMDQDFVEALTKI